MAFISIPKSYFLQVLVWIGSLIFPIEKQNNSNLIPNLLREVKVKYEDVQKNIKTCATNNKLYLHKNNHPDTYLNQFKEAAESKKAEFLNHCKSVEIVYSDKVDQLILDYIDFKKGYGSAEEKKLF